jgi:hypothetical protein
MKVVRRLWGMLSRRSTAASEEKSDQPHAKRITNALQPSMWGKDSEGHALPIAAMPNGRCRMHGGKSPGAPKGNKNAWKHGRYSVEAITLRRLVQVLTRFAKQTFA